MSIKVRIIFKESIPPFNNATVHLYLEDVSYVGKAAIVLAKKIIPHVQHNTASVERNDKTVIDFKLDLEPKMKIYSHNSYAIRVWVDVDNNGESSSKDLFSDQSFRVLTQGFGNKIEIIFNSEIDTIS